MTAIELCAPMTRRFEALRLKAYRDAVGVWTIGYGHTRGVAEGMAIDADQAEALLAEDLARADRGVGRLIAWPLADHQRAPLIDFTFNLGLGALRASTLRRKINRGELAGAAAEFPKWCHAGGRTLRGLVLRRAAERTLFLGE